MIYPYHRPGLAAKKIYQKYKGSIKLYWTEAYTGIVDTEEADTTAKAPLTMRLVDIPKSYNKSELKLQLITE